MNITDENDKRGPSDTVSYRSVKNWLMVGFTIVATSLYAAALLGLIEPLRDASIVARLEPIIFVVLGYYFGRLPGEENEWTLRREMLRQYQKADAAIQLKDGILQQCGLLEEKVRNAAAILSGTLSNKLTTEDPQVTKSVEAARQILDS
jgi:hypothetical protein